MPIVIEKLCRLYDLTVRQGTEVSSVGERRSIDDRARACRMLIESEVARHQARMRTTLDPQEIGESVALLTNFNNWYMLRGGWYCPPQPLPAGEDVP